MGKDNEIDFKHHTLEEDELDKSSIFEQNSNTKTTNSGSGAESELDPELDSKLKNQLQPQDYNISAQV